MEKPNKDTWNPTEYSEWIAKNRKVIKLTRAYFSSIVNNARISNRFGVNWLSVAMSLLPSPKNKGSYHIDHIIPLSYFNFLHEDDSLNLIEIQKAFNPANLRWIRKEDNMSKHTNVNLISYPLRFEYIFKDNKYLEQLYKDIEVIKIKDKEDWNNFMMNLW